MEEQNTQLPNVPQKRPSSLLAVIFSMLITALIVGGGIYYWQNSIALDYQKGLEEAQQQIVLLSEKINEIEQDKADIEQAKLDLEEKNCKGVWENKECIMSTCRDSDGDRAPDDIYIKGEVTYMDKNGNYVTSWDECTGTDIGILENWCNGDSYGGRRGSTCVNGCTDGACINDLCIDEFRKSDIGLEDHPIAAKYAHIKWLGQIFSSVGCDQERIEKIFGVTGDEFTIGLKVWTSLYSPDELKTTLKSIGFSCEDESSDSECLNWVNYDSMKIEDLLKLEPFYESITNDDCRNCG